MNQTSVRIPWPGWEVVKFLGGGSFGSVYEIQRKLFETMDAEKAAVKVIRVPKESADAQELLSSGYALESVNARYLEDLQDIAKEYDMMAKLKGNANVVYCDDTYYEKNSDGIGWTLYIRMELLTPLNQYLPESIPEELVYKLGMDLCNALIACKKHNIIHRDIKPGNIMVAKDGNFKLGDFGVAKTTERTAGGTKTGTYSYMAPEVYNNKPYGLNADIYSLGMVMYWMLNHRCGPFLPLPPTVPSAAELEQAKQRRFDGEPLPLPAKGSDQLKKIVRKACAADPTQRYDSPEALYADLVRAQKGEVWEIPFDDKPKDIPQKRRFVDDNNWSGENENTMGGTISGEDNGGTMGGGRTSNKLGPYDVRGNIQLTQQELTQGCVKPFHTDSGRIVHVTIPAGSAAGDVVCVTGAGKQSAETGARGDLLITLSLRSEKKKDAFGETKVDAELTITPDEAKSGCSRFTQVEGKKYVVQLPGNLTDLQVLTVDAKVPGGATEKLTVRVRLAAANQKSEKEGGGGVVWKVLLAVVLWPTLAAITGLWPLGFLMFIHPVIIIGSHNKKKKANEKK